MLDNLTQEEAAQLLAATMVVIAGLFALMSVYAVIFTRKALKRLSELTGIKPSAEQTEKVIGAVRWGIAYAKEQAEEFAAGKLKEGPRTGAEKLEVAMSAARSVAPAELADKSDKQLAIITKAELQIVRPSLPPAPADSSEHDELVESLTRSSLVPTKLPALPKFSNLGADTIKTPMPPRRNP